MLTPTEENLQAMLFGLVLQMCIKHGMSEEETIQMFQEKNIKGGFAILNERQKK